MTSEPSMTDRPARFSPPWGFLGALVLIFAAERYIEYRSYDWMSPDQWIFRATDHYLSKNARNRDILIFGDSLAKLSLAPKEVERVSGLTGYNFALSGSQAAQSYFLLRRTLASGAKPKLILVDFFPTLLRLPYWHVVENDPFLLTTSEVFEYAWETQDPSFLTSLLARQALPSVRQRQSIREFVLTGKKERRNKNLAAASHLLLRNHSANNGAQVHVAERLTTDFNRYHDDYFDRWEVHATQAKYVTKFFELTQEHGLPIGLVMPPIYNPTRERIERSGFDQKWRASVQEWVDRYPNLFVIDGVKTEYAESAFMDPCHLSKDGLSTFSQDVGTLLAAIDRGETTGRWHRLPKYHPPEETDRIEDLPASRMVLRRIASQSNPKQETAESKKRTR